MDDTGVCKQPGDCDWQPVEVLLEATAADVVSTCVTCGATGYEAGQGRTRRPALPDILFTTGELPPGVTPPTSRGPSSR